MFFHLGLSIWDTFTSVKGTIPVTEGVETAYNPTSILDKGESLYSGNTAAESYLKAEFDVQVCSLQFLFIIENFIFDSSH